MYDSVEMTGNQFQQNISIELTDIFRPIFNRKFYQISCSFNRIINSM